MIRLDTQILQISDNRTPGIYLPFPQEPRLCVTASCNRLIGCPTSRHLVWLPKREKSHTCFLHSLTDMCRPASVVSMILHPRAEFLEMNILRKKKCLAQAASDCSPHNVCSGAAEISVVFGYLFVCLECPTLSVFGGAVGSGKGTQQRLLFSFFFFFSPPCFFGGSAVVVLFEPFPVILVRELVSWSAGPPRSVWIFHTVQIARVLCGLDICDFSFFF